MQNTETLATHFLQGRSLVGIRYLLQLLPSPFSTSNADFTKLHLDISAINTSNSDSFLDIRAVFYQLFAASSAAARQFAIAIAGMSGILLLSRPRIIYSCRIVESFSTGAIAV